MFLNTVMCVDVLRLLPHAAHLHALVRSAGSRGAAVYEELVKAGGVALCTEVLVTNAEQQTQEGDGDTSATPTTLTTTTTHVPLSCIPRRPTTFGLLSTTVVANHTAIAKYDNSLSFLHNNAIGKLKFVCAGCVEEVHATYEKEYLSGDLGLMVRSVELEGFNNITKIGNAFLSDFITIKEIDLSPLRNVTVIGDNFLQNCSQLTPTSNLLAPLQNVVTIGTHFLSGGKSIETIDFTPLGQVTTIGSHFMYLCSFMESCDIAALKNVSSLDKECFFFGCHALKNAVNNNQGGGAPGGEAPVLLPPYSSPFCSVEVSTLAPELRKAAEEWLEMEEV